MLDDVVARPLHILDDLFRSRAGTQERGRGGMQEGRNGERETERDRQTERGREGGRERKSERNRESILSKCVYVHTYF